MTAYRVTNTSIVLGDISNHFSAHKISESQRKNLSVIAASLVQVLNDVDNILSKQSKLESKATSFRGHVGRAWDRVTFDNEEIRDLRSRLVSTLKALTSFVDGLDRKVMTELVTDQASRSVRQDQLRNQKILDWLASADYAAQHSSIRNRCFAGTGRWILECPEYQRWLRGKGEVLYLQGIPGAGKTFLSAVIIESIQRLPGTGLCYYYCDYDRATDGQLCDVLACFLRQLMYNSISLSVESMFEEHYKNGTRPSLHTIREALQLVIKDLKAVWIVVDALDEYSDTLQRHKFVEELLNLNKATKVNVLVTSRPLPEISRNFAHSATLEVRARDDDMRSYIASHIGALPNFVDRDPDLKKRITDSIIEIADGIFLLVALNLKSLQNMRSKGDLENTLKSLKKGDSGYQNAYAKTMERISSQDRDGLAIDALTWIVYAARPLKILELQHALGTKTNTSEFDESFIPDSDDILDACCGLIRIENESEVVRLIHRTTVDYLKGDGAAWLKEGHMKLSDVCNTYVDFIDVKQGPEDILEHYPLYDYVNLFRDYHNERREQLPDLQQLVKLQQRSTKSSRNISEKAVAEYHHHSRSLPGIIGLHLTSICGLTELMPHFLEFCDVNEEDGFHRTPVSYAVEQGQYEALSVLIGRNAHLDFIYGSGDTLLTHAVRADFNNILTILVKSRSPQLDVPNKDGYTPLHLAALYRNVLAFRILLEAGADPNVLDNLGCTPLLYAVKLEYSEYKTDKWGQSRLKSDLFNEYGMSDEDLEECVIRMNRQNTMRAEDYESIVGQLLTSGANLNLADRSGRTPIWYAHRQGSLASLAYIYKRSMHQQDKFSMADITCVSNTGEQRTASSLCGVSSLNIVTARLPVDIGVYTDNYKKRTILHTVAMSNNISMLIWLLHNQTSTGEATQDERISPQQLVLNYQHDAVKYLPDIDWLNSADVPERIDETWFNASLQGSFRVLKLLVQYQAMHNSMIGVEPDASQAESIVDVDIEYTDANSQKCQKICPMYKEAIQREHWLHAVDKHGQNALHMSIRRGHSITAKYLLEHGSNRYAKDKYGRTILEYACLGSPGAKFMEVIVGSGILEHMIVRENTWSPLHWACRFGDIKLLCLLAEAGFTISVVSTEEPKADWTPLDVAICCGNVCLVDLNGHLKADLYWESLIDCGLVTRDELSGEIVPARKNGLTWLPRLDASLSCAICSDV